MMERLVTFFAVCALVSCGTVLFSKARLIPYTPATVIHNNKIRYMCPDGQERSFEYTGPLPREEMVLFVKPNPLYPFNPIHVTIGAPQFVDSGYLSAGTCALWAYVVHRALSEPHPLQVQIPGTCPMP